MKSRTGNFFILGLGGAIALFMTGCGLFGGGDGTDTATAPPPEASPAPAAPAAPPAATPAASPTPQAQPFSGQIVPGQVPTPGPAPGLIPPTNGAQRAKEITTGRGDPFASVPVRATVTVTGSGQGATGGGTGSGPATPGNVPPPLPPLPRPNVGGQTTGGGSRAIPVPRPNTPTAGQTTRPQGSPPPVIARVPTLAPLEPKLPTLPTPSLAQGVRVSGVVAIGGVPQAIITSPLDVGQSRYVREGERIADGQVLVKRISVTGGLTPVVVLEQFGQEVVKTIENSSTTPTAQADPGTAPGQG